MTDRRREHDRAFLNQPALQRIAARLDENLSAISERIEAGFDRIDGRIDRLDRDMAQGELDRQKAQGEMAELRRDLGELRDAFGLAEGRRVEGAAKGAAAGALEAVKPIAVQTAASFWKTKWGAAVAAAVGFTAIVTAAEKAPRAARWLNEAWAYVSRHEGYAPPPQKDTTDGR